MLRECTLRTRDQEYRFLCGIMEAGRCTCSKALPPQRRHQERLWYLYQRPWRPAAAAGPVACIRDPRALVPALWKGRPCSRKRRSISLRALKPCVAYSRPTNAPIYASSFPLGASTAGFDANNGSEDPISEVEAGTDAKENTIPELAPNREQKGYLQAAGVISGVTLLGTLTAVSVTLASGGPAALVAAISKSGFFAAFALIFVSEIGDKTFFIAALLAMRHSRGLVLLGSMGALSLMTVISVVIGRLCQRVPAQLQTTLPIGEYAAVGLLILFGLKAIKNAWDLPSTSNGTEDAVAESGELADAEEFVKQAEAEKKLTTPMAVLGESFSLVFLAEWGDRSMLATVALGAAQSPWGVASGAIVAHALATLLAILGGAFLARYISEKVVGYIGGILFLVFAAATLMGVF